MRELIFFLGLQVKQKEDGIFISQDKYVNEILNKFRFSDVKTASTPMETHKTLLKDENGEDVDEHLYRFMIGSLMYLTSARLDIMFAVCACARFQVNPKISHLHAVKRIFRYLKGQPKLGLWYPKVSSFDLVVYTDSDYAGASLDRKSTTGSCQLLGCRLISWQCKKQTVVANFTTEAKYVAASSCCGQVLWIQNQLLDYGDSNEKKLIQMIKIHTDKNVTYLLTKAFDEGCLEWNGKAAKDEIVYTSCIEQFWTTTKAKNINGEAQIHAKVDGKKVIISEASIRIDLQFGDEGETVVDEAVIKEMYDSLERAATTITSLDAENDRDTIEDTITQTKSKNVSKFSNDPLLAKVNTPQSREDSLKLPELMELYTNLQQRVFDLETTKTTKAKEITSLKKRVKILEKKRRSRTQGLKRLYKVGLSARVGSSADEARLDEEDSSKQGRISNIDANQDIYLVNVYRDEEIFAVNNQDDTSMFDADKDLQGKEVVVEKEVAGEDVSVATTTTIAAITPTISMDEIALAKALIEIKTSRPKAKGIYKSPEKRRKFFAAKRAEEKRNKPPTKAQQRKIKDLFDKAMKKINNFVDFKTELVEKSKKKHQAKIAQESSSKRAGDELEQEIDKKQRIENENESTKVKRCLEIVLNDGDDVTIDDTSLCSKSPTIFDYKIYKEELMLLVQMLQLLKVKTAERVSTIKEWIKTEDWIKIMENIQVSTHVNAASAKHPFNQ
nr:uncharacterized mitochondrial protein AtMg00810-like [Tanacetum cinerariifolium]